MPTLQISLHSMALNHLFNRISIILRSAYRCCNRRIKAILMALMTVFFTTTSHSQLEKQAINAKESEGIQYIWAMNIAQQGYYAENGDFTDTIPNLGSSIQTQTANYNYSISKGSQAVFNYATAREQNLKSFVGGVFLVGDEIQTILCQANVADTTKPANPINDNGVLLCGVNTTEVSNSPLRSNARQSVSSMNRAQQAYYAENGSFTDSLPKLGIGIRAQNPNYNYSMILSNEAVFNYGISRESDLYSYVGGVFLVGDIDTDISTKTIVCVANLPGTVQPANPTNNNGVLACAANTTEVNNNLPSAQKFVSSMNLAQQAYYAENDTFTDTVEKLGLGISPENPQYNYSIQLSNNTVFHYGISRQSDLKSYVGGVFLVPNIDNQIFFKRILCVANLPGMTQPAHPINNNGILACGADTVEVSNPPRSLNTDARQYIFSMNIAQQAYYAMHDGFTDSLEKLGGGIKAETPNYNYSIHMTNNAVFHYGISRESGFKSYVGGVFLLGTGDKEMSATHRILCVANLPGTIQPANPINNNGVLVCGADTTKVSL